MGVKRLRVEPLGAAENRPERLFNKNTGPCRSREAKYRG